MDFPFEQKIIDNKIIRTFNPDVDIEELKWHQDLKNREVTIIQNGGWKFQNENTLPISLQDGQKIHIPKLSWHRVIKGEEKLVVEIIEID